MGWKDSFKISRTHLLFSIKQIPITKGSFFPVLNADNGGSQQGFTMKTTTEVSVNRTKDADTRFPAFWKASRLFYYQKGFIVIIDHIGIAVRSIVSSIAHWEHVFGYKQSTKVTTNSRQKVNVVFLEQEGSIDIVFRKWIKHWAYRYGQAC